MVGSIEQDMLNDWKEYILCVPLKIVSSKVDKYPKNDCSRTWPYHIAGVLYLFLSIIFFLSLLSYQPFYTDHLCVEKVCATALSLGIKLLLTSCVCVFFYWKKEGY